MKQKTLCNKKGVKVVELPPENEPCSRCICVYCMYGFHNDFTGCLIFRQKEPCDMCEHKSWVEDCALFLNRYGEDWTLPPKKWLEEAASDMSIWGY